MTQETLEQDARELYDALSELVRIYQFRDRDRICCYELTLSQANALDAIARHGPLSMNDLSGRMLLDKSTTSRVVDSLVRKGLVVREPDPDDRRALRLECTKEGLSTHRSITRDIVERESGVLGDFDPQVRRAMIDMISRLAHAAGERVEASGGSCCCLDG